MFHQSLVKDAWIREAEEASTLMEDLESRVKNNNLEQHCPRDSARSKLLELGVKLDRLEALLHNPPSKPILTDQDLEFRWKLLSDIQLRTRAVALNLYTLQCTNRPGSLPTEDTKEATRTANSNDQGHTKVTISKEDPELLTPLVVEGYTYCTRTSSPASTKMCTSSGPYWLSPIHLPHHRHIEALLGLLENHGATVV
ncbi:hypothetical protein L1049_021332 [Liquidambar formosana]|uniref:Uncharacterized protein n=1 Tax=Liquidambar formosana TaxID=63359 RepID=A0AAP0S9Q6_LIQFO